MKLWIIFALALGLTCSVNAEEGSPRAKTPPAILEASAEKGLRLSEKAQQTIGLAMAKTTPSDRQSLPLSALVYYQDHVGLYRFRAGWFKLLEVQLLEKGSSQASVRTKDLAPGDQIVVGGVPLLRVAEMEAFGGGE